MHELDERLARFGAAFESDTATTMPEPRDIAPRSSHSDRRRWPIISLAAAAILLLAVSVAVTRPGDERAVRSTPDPTSASSASSPLSTSPHTSQVPTASDAAVSSPELPHLGPSWLPDGAEEIGAEQIRFGTHIDGWVQIYFSSARPDGWLFIASGGMGGNPPQQLVPLPAVDAWAGSIGSAGSDLQQAIAGLTRRDSRPGWDLPSLPDGYQLMVEGPFGGTAVRRTWSTPAGGTIHFVVMNGLEGLTVAASAMTAARVADNGFLGIQFALPGPVNNTLFWSPAPGIVAAVSSTDHHRGDLVEIATSAIELADEEWLDIVSGAVRVSADEPEAGTSGSAGGTSQVTPLDSDLAAELTAAGLVPVDGPVTINAELGYAIVHAVRIDPLGGRTDYLCEIREGLQSCGGPRPFDPSRSLTVIAPGSTTTFIGDGIVIVLVRATAEVASITLTTADGTTRAPVVTPFPAHPDYHVAAIAASASNESGCLAAIDRAGSPIGRSAVWLNSWTVEPGTTLDDTSCDP